MGIFVDGSRPVRHFTRVDIRFTPTIAGKGSSNPMENQLVISERRGAVLCLTLNRPDVLNSFNSAMARELLAGIEEARRDNQVRALLLSGAGKGFCAGQDLKEVLEMSKAGDNDLGKIVENNYNPLIRAIRRIEKPVIAAVNGIAAGAGANLAFACDIVIASRAASFTQSFSKIGLIPDSGGTFVLPRLVGMARASALMMLAEKISADDAVSMGLIYRCEPEDTFLDEAMRIAEYLATQPTAGLGLIKRGLNRSLGNDLDSQLDLERDLQSIAGHTHDYQEGVQAFVEKRAPQFSGK